MKEPSAAPRDYTVAYDAASPRSGTVSVAWVLLALLRHRRTILIPTVIGMLIGLAFALTRRPTFTTDFSFLPQGSQDATRGALAGLAGQFGISLGAAGGPSQPPQFYADVLEGREVLGAISRDSVTDVDGRRVAMPQFLDVESTDSLERTQLTILALRGIGVALLLVVPLIRKWMGQVR